MPNKSLAIIIDDFSDRIFEYDNVTLYDYGSYNQSQWFDYVGYNPDGSYGFSNIGPGSDEILDINNIYNDFFRISDDNIEEYDWLHETAYINTNVSSQTDNLTSLYGANLGFDNVVAEGVAVDNAGYFLLDNYGDAILYSNIETIVRQDTNPFTECEPR